MNRTFAELADAYADGALDAPQAERLLAYLNGSPAAVRHLRALAVVDLGLRGAAAGLDADQDAAGFRRELLGRIRAHGSGRRFRVAVERRIAALRARQRRGARVTALRAPAALAAALLVGLLATLTWPGARAAAPAGPAAITSTIAAAQGWVTIEGARGQRSAAAGGDLAAGDLVTTGAGASAAIRLADGSVLRLAPSAALRVAPADGARARLERGVVDAAAAKQGPGQPAILSAPGISVHVLGTRFQLGALDGLTTLAVSEGRVALRTGAGPGWTVDAGQSLRLRAGRAERAGTIALRRSDDPAWRSAGARTVADLLSFAGAEVPGTRWGGRADLQLSATGGFHAEARAGRWWLVDPDGHPLLLAGVSDVAHLGGLAAPELRAGGGPGGWADAAVALLRGAACNAVGGPCEFGALAGAEARAGAPLLAVSCSDVALDFAHARLRARPPLAALSGGRGLVQFLAPLLPGFPDHVRAWAGGLAAGAHDHAIAAVVTERQSCVDTEFTWTQLRAAAQLDEELRAALAAWLAARGATWATAGADDLQALRQDCLAGYRDLVFPAARRAAPGALLLGQVLGLHALPREELRDTLIAPVDALATYLVGRWLDGPEPLVEASARTGKPLWIDFLFAKGADRGLANPGNGLEVRDQGERARFYQHQVLQMLQSRAVIGWQWFRYEDVGEDAAAGFVSNKGLVDRAFTPYQRLVAGIAEVNRQRYALADYFDGGAP